MIMRKFKMILGGALFIAGLVCSSAQKEDGGPAPVFTLGAAVVMIIGGKILAGELEEEDGRE